MMRLPYENDTIATYCVPSAAEVTSGWDVV